MTSTTTGMATAEVATLDAMLSWPVVFASNCAEVNDCPRRRHRGIPRWAPSAALLRAVARDSAEPAPAIAVRFQCADNLALIEIRPVNGSRVVLGVSGLPQQEVTQSHLARGPG